jgi:serine/threonine-protein kinase
MSPDSPLHQPDWLAAHQPSVGRYVLGPILGQGGAGEVREAWDVVLCRTVALKVLRKMEPVGLIRFMHEAQIQSRIVHPNICRIYDVDNGGGVPKIAMQLVRGPTLAQVAQELTVKEVVTLLAQVAEAIHAAHRVQLIHRDLKPSNILLEQDAEGVWIPYVCDFGLAVALDEPTLTLGPGLMGTPAFMAPEQILGQRHRVGPATDIYALGGTLHYALYGAAPGGLPDNGAPLELRRHGIFEPFRHPSPDLPRDLETILRKCLDPDPDRRYGSALALAEDLWLFRNGAPIHARPIGALERVWRRSRPYRAVALLAFLALCGILAGRVAEKASLTREQTVRSEWTRFFVLEAADMEKEMRLEKMMPIHDMRPAKARLQARMEAIRAQMRTLGPGVQGPGHYALGLAAFLQSDYAGARQELEQAWALGYQEPEEAWLLANSLVVSAGEINNAAIFATGAPAPDSAAVAERAQALFLRGRAAQGSRPQFAEAMLAFSKQDYPAAAASAHASIVAQPWRFEAAALESMSLSALGRQRYDAGDLRGAETRYRQAMTAAQRFIAIGPSDDFTNHVYFLAGTRLAMLLGSRGRPSLDLLQRLRTRCATALTMDPRQPELQDDWIRINIISALRLRDLGRDDGPALDSTLAYLETWARAPLTVELRTHRMLLHWHLAERNFALGQDPGPELEAALKDLGHTGSFLHRDYLGDILNFKARVEMGRGLDPRPTLDQALDRMNPLLERDPSWTACETIAKSWYLRAAWEEGHGQDARTSLDHAHAMANWTLRINPRSAAGQELEAMIEALAVGDSAKNQGPLLKEARNLKSGCRAPRGEVPPRMSGMRG